MMRWMLAVLVGSLAGCAATNRPIPQHPEGDTAKVLDVLPNETSTQQTAARQATASPAGRPPNRPASTTMRSDSMPSYATRLSMLTDESASTSGRILDWQPSVVETMEEEEPLTSAPSVRPDPLSGEPSFSILEESAPRSREHPQLGPRFWDRPVIHKLLADQRHFYSFQNLAWLGVGLGGAAILANTTLDQQFQNVYDRNIGVGDTDLDWGKDFGNGALVIPALAGIWLIDLGYIAWMDPEEDSCAMWLEEWSGRSIRGLLVGAVPLLTLQWVTGGGRPNEEDFASRWTGFENTHGISGHAFVGAVPWFTAARMTDSAVLKAGFYSMALFPGISRIHNDAHYLSQVMLGWWVAWLSVRAVNATEGECSGWAFTPVVIDGHPGIGLLAQW